MDERRPQDDAARAVPALVEAQLQNARAEVFRAYLAAQARARELAERDPAAGRPPAAG